MKYIEKAIMIFLIVDILVTVGNMFITVKLAKDFLRWK